MADSKPQEVKNIENESVSADAGTMKDLRGDVKEVVPGGEAREGDKETTAVEAIGEAERIRNEEYKIWKKQSPFLYDACISSAMLSPSAAIQWYPSRKPYAIVDEGGPFDTYSLLLTDKGETLDEVSLLRAEVGLPSKNFSKKPPTPEQRERVGKLSIKEAWVLPADSAPLVARFCPENPQFAASADRSGDVVVVGKDPRQILHGHTGAVFDLSWRADRQIASASMDGTVRLWDLETSSTAHILSAGTGSVNCVQYAPLNDSELASGGDDYVVRFWDSRQGKEARVITEAHSAPITAMHYNPHNEMILATASADGVIAVWDVRMSSASLAGLANGPGPALAISALKWSPFDESVLASGGADCQVKVWDLSLHGKDQTPLEEQEGPPELIFIHGGHLESVTDIDWHPTLPWTLASVGEDNLASVWRIASCIVDKV